MRDLLFKQGRSVRPCVLGCGREADKVAHYGRCNVYWHFLERLGIPYRLQSAETFFMLTDLLAEDKVRLAIGMYSLHMTVQHCRHSSDHSHVNVMAMLRIFAFRGASGSKASLLLRGL